MNMSGPKDLVLKIKVGGKRKTFPFPPTLFSTVALLLMKAMSQFRTAGRLWRHLKGNQGWRQVPAGEQVLQVRWQVHLH